METMIPSPQAPQPQAPISDELEARHIITNQMVQTIANIELDGLPEHTAKKVKATTPNEEYVIAPSESYPTTNMNLPDMKFLHNNPYLVIASKLDLYNDQCTTMQQNEPIQNIQNIKEQVKEVTIDRTHTIMEERRAVLEANQSTLTLGPQNQVPQKRKMA
ncbi:28704_t:CDS:2 [Gigaspora margarita]|uniref:28704_t:CDS:1 n=1 Tax=Gigaspora margarita TaxID=4874 RepID=A0ABN7UW74_GIGMA|nr:28704_t:CDS:2 [Gigaspora margarita]